MHTRTLFCLVSIAVLSPLLRSQTIAPPPPPVIQYTVASQLPFSQAEDHIDGRIQLIEDARLTPQLREAIWGKGDIESRPELSAFKADPPHNAMLRIIPGNGAAARTFPLERPLAKLEAANLYETPQPTFLLTVDYSQGAGSSGGPVTMLIELRNGAPQRLTAVDQATGKEQEIALISSPNTTWRIVDSPSGNGKEILNAACRLDPTHLASKPKPGDFTRIYTRYYFDGSRWKSVERKERGYSEFQTAFPSRHLFP